MFGKGKCYEIGALKVKNATKKSSWKINKISLLDFADKNKT